MILMMGVTGATARPSHQPSLMTNAQPGNVSTALWECFAVLGYILFIRGHSHITSAAIIRQGQSEC